MTHLNNVLDNDNDVIMIMIHSQTVLGQGVYLSGLWTSCSGSSHPCWAGLLQLKSHELVGCALVPGGLGASALFPWAGWVCSNPWWAGVGLLWVRGLGRSALVPRTGCVFSGPKDWLCLLWSNSSHKLKPFTLLPKQKQNHLFLWKRFKLCGKNMTWEPEIDQIINDMFSFN